MFSYFYNLNYIYILLRTEIIYLQLKSIHLFMTGKMYFLTFFMIWSCTFTYSQTDGAMETAINHIRNNADKWQLKSSDYNNLTVSSQTTSDQGITYLYLTQTYNSIPVRNAMMTVIINKDGKVVSDAHDFVSNIESKVNAKSATLTPDVAILESANHLGISVKGKPLLSKRSDNGIQTYEFPELTKSPILARLKYEVVNDKLVLVWNLSLNMKSSSDYWDMNVDANTGKFVSKNNFTLYCRHHKDAFVRHDNCEIRTFRKVSDHHQAAPSFSATGAVTAKYNVFKLPAESPSHGDRQIVTDAQFPTASPFGWHDTNGVDGAEFTTTQGNNVYAYEDKNDDDDTDGADPNGGQDLNFDFPIDLSKDPRQSNNAAVTNLFYMNNMMHDVTNLLGFTEEFGSFQKKNYSAKAIDGEDDYILAQAFDGIEASPVKLNNANFSTPPDGFNGVMQMFLWGNEGGSISIDAPEELKGFVADYGTGQFGKPIPNTTEPAITGSVAIARDGSNNPTAACNTVINGSEINGKIAIVNRGICDFSNKVFRAQQAGAIAVIVCNIAGVNGGTGEELLGMAGGLNAASVTVPSIFMKKSDCDKIRLVIANGGQVVMTFKERERQGAEYLDGSLDNGIIAHEYAHGISNRLTGGRQAASCLSNDEQMGEGWSDFFSLIMTHEPGDKGTDSRGIGTFAFAQLPIGGGIRTYPYSTDMKINPQTYDDIKGTSSPYPPGEVWTDMLWDMYWAFVDLYGYNADWTNKNSGNYKAVYLVMEGMKMQPCNPGLIDGRNAILKADEVHNNGANKCMIWNVFARRGLGYFADGANKDNRNDGTENFESLPICIEKLKISKTSTASINAGDEVTVSLKAINHIPSKQPNVIITDDLPDGMSYVSGSSNVPAVVSGNSITFELGDMDYEREINITYKTKSSINNTSIRLELESFDGSFEWDIEKNEGSEDWLPTSDVFRSPDQAFNIINVAAESDASLRSIPYKITGNNPVMRFWHRYNTQPGNDGGFVEISVDGAPYTLVKSDKFIRNGYNGPLAYATLATPSLDAFSGNSGGNWTGNLVGPWKDSYIDMSEYKGKTVVFRFRFASDETVAASGDLNGWFIDDFELLDIYKYTAQACIAADAGQGEKACTLPFEIIVNSQEGVNSTDDTKDIFAVTLSPNPADDYVVITAMSPFESNAVISISSMEGKTLNQQMLKLDNTFRPVTINTSSLASGIYLVKIQSGNHVSTRKLIIK